MKKKHGNMLTFLGFEKIHESRRRTMATEETWILSSSLHDCHEAEEKICCWPVACPFFSKFHTEPYLANKRVIRH